MYNGSSCLYKLVDFSQVAGVYLLNGFIIFLGPFDDAYVTLLLWKNVTMVHWHSNSRNPSLMNMVIQGY